MATSGTKAAQNAKLLEYKACPEGPKKQRLLDALIRENTPLVKKLVARFLKYTRAAIDFDDAMQAGLIGLMIAIRRFDPTKGRLSTYAGHWINWELRQAISRELIIQYPKSVTGMPYKIFNLAEKIEGQTGKPATAAELGVTEEDLKKWQALVFHFEGVVQDYEDGEREKLADQSDLAVDQMAAIERERKLLEILNTMPGEERERLLNGDQELAAKVIDALADY